MAHENVILKTRKSFFCLFVCFCDHANRTASAPLQRGKGTTPELQGVRLFADVNQYKSRICSKYKEGYSKSGCLEGGKDGLSQHRDTAKYLFAERRKRGPKWQQLPRYVQELNGTTASSSSSVMRKAARNVCAAKWDTSQGKVRRSNSRKRKWNAFLV